jgi:hypothetical protein
MVDRFHSMVNPSVLQQLGKEHQREILEASRIPRTADSLVPRARRRLGWSLIGLGAHLAMDGQGRGSGPWHHFPGDRRIHPLGPLARP